MASLPRGGGEGGLGRMQDRSRRMAGLASPSNTLRSPGPLTRPAARDRAFFGGGAVDRGWVGGGAVGERRDGIHRARAADVAAGPAAGRTHPAELSVRGRHVGVFGGEKEGNKGACLMMHWSDMSTARPRLRLFVGRHGVVEACRVKRLRPATHPYSPPAPAWPQTRIRAPSSCRAFGRRWCASRASPGIWKPFACSDPKVGAGGGAMGRAWRGGSRAGVFFDTTAPLCSRKDCSGCAGPVCGIVACLPLLAGPARRVCRHLPSQRMRAPPPQAQSRRRRTLEVLLSQTPWTSRPACDSGGARPDCATA